MARLLLVLVLVLGLGLLTALGRAADEAPRDKPKAAESYIKVEVKGKLQTGVVAIGGETTGTVVQAKSGTLELELDNKQKAEAEKLKGKVVLVTGELRVQRGVTIGQRLIVKVATLKAADSR